MPSMNMETAVPYQPSLRDMVLLELPLEVKLSPNGSKVAIRVRSTNWNKNEYEHRCHVHDLATGTTRQINRTGNVKQMAWLDDETLALLKKEHDDEEAQVWIYEGLVGEGWLATSHKSNIDWFESFAGGLLYLTRNPQRGSHRRPGRDAHKESLLAGQLAGHSARLVRAHLYDAIHPTGVVEAGNVG